ncbi:MAG: NUDIX domain-containing protein [Bdellovibrionales bacterium]
MSPSIAKATSGAGIIVFHQEKILLVQMNYGRFKGHWIIPGGSVDEGEHPDETALRELKEETGLEGRIDGLLAVRYRQKNLKNNTYWVFSGSILTKNPEQSLQWPKEELIEARFWTLDDCMKDDLVRPLTKVFINKFIDSKNLAKSYEIPTDKDQNDRIYGL